MKAGLDKVSYYDTYTVGKVVELSVSRDYSRFDAPDKYKLTIRGEYTQDDIFNIAKTVFREDIAEYLIYQDSNSSYSASNSSKLIERLETPDEKFHYTVTRDASVYLGITSVSLSFEFYGGYENYRYKNDYVPMVLDLPIDKMLEYDVGGTDYRKGDFYNKALAYGDKYDPFESNYLDSTTLNQATLSDGTKYYNLVAYSYRLSETDKESPKGLLKGNKSYQVGLGERKMSFLLTARKDTDGKITVNNFESRLPTTWSVQKNFDAAVVDDMLAIAEKQAVEVFGLDSKIFDGVQILGDDDTSAEQQKSLSKFKVTDGQVKLYGNTMNAEISASAYGKLSFGGSDNQSATYYSYIIIKNK